MPRKRKPGARTKSGRLSRAYRGPARDAGTSELQEKRLALVGENADPALSATPLGCIFARGYLDARDDHGLAKERYEKGLEFGKLHAALYQRHRNSTGPEATDDRLEELQRRFNAMVDVITPEQRSVLTDVCAFNGWPIWFDTDRLKLHRLPEDDRSRDALIDGLDALVTASKKPRKAA